ncbi:MAG: Ig-like domain-containing protein [Eubacterium coprostanoligenes]|uniref:Ig-like domain-containing protein n=1 Tax=Eubacterium coprostanoligenes TaxID=290054 RepID=UPI00240A9404|nr:Ig-like domain-containing protein [Eubacterium coprostanoligenes]MDD6665654.1 Ig-like domain-containing protein [Eubacterium coprostanoligenes]
MKKVISLLLSLSLIFSVGLPGTLVNAAESITIYYNDAELTETLHITEYDSAQLVAHSESELPAGSTVEWESNMPLLADVDETGEVTAYDYSKAAVIKYWLDNEVRPTPLIGNATADAIEKAFANAGIDLNDSNLNTELVVAIVKGINQTMGESLEKMLNNMTITITARLVNESGKVLASDKAEIAVDQSLAGNIWPTGVHITNKKTVPKTVAVGKQVQMYGAVTPVRLKQSVKWSVGKALDTESRKHATITSDGLVTFTSPGTVYIRANPDNALYSAVTDTVEFKVVSREELPVTDFSIGGTLDIKEGETSQLTIENASPAGAYTGDVKWECSDSSAAVITQDGVVTALDAGQGLQLSKTVTITATIDGVSKTASLKINRNIIGEKINSVEINGYENIALNETNKYTADVTPVRLNTNTGIVRQWGLYDSQSGELVLATADTPADNGFASIDSNGNLVAREVGIIKIYVKVSYNDTSLEAEKTVSSGVPITSFSLSKGNGFTTNILTGSRDSFLEEGKTGQLNITNILPEGYDPDLLKNVVWKSSDPSVASVDENGKVLGLDSGGLTIYNAKSVTITAIIGGVSSSVTFNVRGASVNNLVSASISGNDVVVKDFPREYSAIFSPSRISVKHTHWGLTYDDGTRPWNSSWNSTSGNTENSVATVDSNGKVYGKSAGTTTLWVFGREGATSLSGSYVEASKQIQVVEIQPKNIAVTAPEKYDYIEGETELDLTGLKVSATYDRNELANYYSDAESYGDSILSVDVDDYEISGFDPTLIDREQYVLVTLVRAGEQFRAVFPVKVNSKAVESIDITAPKYAYVEGVKQLDLSGLKVYANYSNSPREEVFDYTVDDSAVDYSKLDVEQTVKVVYKHYGRSATAEFPIIIYGKPVVSVDTADYDGSWTGKDVVFTLSSTHQLDGTKYYYNVDGGEWNEINGNSLTVTENTDSVYTFKAINSAGIESEITQPYTVKIDKIVPSFTLVQDNTNLTNQSYSVRITDLNIGASGVKAVYLNGSEIDSQTEFTVTENGNYTVKIVSNSLLESEQSISVNNIDTQKPIVTEISIAHKDTNDFARLINEISFGMFFNKTTELTISAEDVGVAGVDRIEYRFIDENGTPLNDWAVYDDSNKPLQDSDFKGYAEARAIDKAGNVSDSKSTIGYIIDVEAPTEIVVTADADGENYESDSWTSKDVTIKLSSTAFSGIFRYYYSLNGSDWVEMDSDTLVVKEQGEWNYRFKAVSYSNNETVTENDFVVKIDKTEPVVRVDFEGTFGRWTADDVKFSMSILNQAISGVHYYFSTDNGNSWIPAEEGSVITIDEDVDASYIFKAVNGAGVESNYSDSYHIMIDTVAPSLEYTLDENENNASSYKAYYRVNTGLSGLKSVSVNGKDITNSDYFEVTDNGRYVVVMTANNGLTTTEVINVNNIPVSEKPVLYVTPSGTIGSETSQAVTFTLSSPNCNNAVYYYNNGEGWVQIDGDTFVISKAGDYNLTFKAVCGELESYPSPTYSVKLTADYYTAVFKTTVLESKDSDTGSVALGGVKVYVDDKFVGTTDDDGKVSCLLKQGEHSVLLDNETFNRTMKVDVTEDVEFNAPMVALDLNKDGCINAKDYVIIREIADSQLATLYSEIFINFYNEFDSTFSYQN